MNTQAAEAPKKPVRRATKPKDTLIHSEISKGRQDAKIVQVWKVGEYKVRLTILSDSYDFQSRAFAEVWNPNELKWNNVHSIPFSQMQTPHKLYYDRMVGKHHFQRDLDTLMSMVRSVIL